MNFVGFKKKLLFWFGQQATIIRQISLAAEQMFAVHRFFICLIIVIIVIQKKLFAFYVFN